jgi:inositol-hexakisphosphate kinase
MTSIYYSHSHSHPPSPPDFADDSPPISPPDSFHPRRSISDPHPSEPLPRRSPSPITHHHKSDDLVATLLDANPAPPSSRPRVAHRRSSPRLQTLPATYSTYSDLPFSTSLRTPKPLSRRSSSGSTASSSSDTSPPPSSHTRTPQQNSAGIGRKVADSLQLFKESVSLPETEVINPLAFASACSPSHRRISSHSPSDEDDHVIGHFEFVKRADWQEREAATHRRERSMLTLDMARARENLVGVSQERRQSQSRRKERVDPSKGGGLDDRSLYSKDSPKQRDTRGRARDRQQQSSLAFSPATQPTPPAPSYHDLCLTPTVTSPPRLYPLSPSPSRRISLPASQFQLSPDFPSPTILTSSHHACASELSHSRSTTPIRTVSQLPSGVHHDRDLVSPPSPWTTDDESAWESASVTSTASISSPHSPPEPLESNPGVTWPTDNEYDIPSRSPVDDDVGVDGRYHAQFEPSEDVLPHIPLRPFRNQVGGHTSIYKFTKRAVCKVRVTPDFRCDTILMFHPKCIASGFKGEPVL